MPIGDAHFRGRLAEVLAGALARSVFAGRLTGATGAPILGEGDS